MKKENIALLIKMLSVFVCIVATTIIFIILPKNGILPVVKNWFAVVALGMACLNIYQTNFILKLKEGVSPWDLFSTFGRVKIRQNPDAYFSPEDYQNYRNFFKITVVYLVIVMLSLFILISVKK